MTSREQIRYFAQQAGVDVDAGYARTRAIRRLQALPTEGIACNLELLRILRAAGARVAVATGSSRPSILPIMAEHGIEADATVTAEDITRGKPFPDLFLAAARARGMAAQARGMAAQARGMAAQARGMAAQARGMAPQHCVVIEDSDAGIAEARAGGMPALRFFAAR
jgi:beta-phosphoglucomutase-like phosphatase (HAD superfamily)